ncbi:hypothetical protein CRUP_028963 [Coryphaenoides rupestris]|nr:hypothetical protein CRUP_028963 [Coryphaenoides rupestris]
MNLVRRRPWLSGGGLDADVPLQEKPSDQEAVVTPMSPLLSQMEAFCGRFVYCSVAFCGRYVFCGHFVYSNPKVQAFLRLNRRVMDKAWWTWMMGAPGQDVRLHAGDQGTGARLRRLFVRPGIRGGGELTEEPCRRTCLVKTTRAVPHKVHLSLILKKKPLRFFRHPDLVLRPPVLKPPVLRPPELVLRPPVLKPPVLRPPELVLRPPELVLLVTLYSSPDRYMSRLTLGRAAGQGAGPTVRPGGGGRDKGEEELPTESMKTRPFSPSALQFPSALHSSHEKNHLRPEFCGRADSICDSICSRGLIIMVDMKLSGLLLLLCCHGGSSVIHSLQYLDTGSSGFSTFPEFVGVVMVDGLHIIYYDSNTQTTELKQVWMDQLARDNPGYLEEQTGIYQSNQQVFKDNIENLKQLFNETGGTQILQVMYGCEWDEDDEVTGGYHQYGYDEEDFISFDLKTLTWIAHTPEALPTKQLWDRDTARNQYLKHSLTKVCVHNLKVYLTYGKSTLQRTERPQVSLLQRTPSSPVVCHATGFYPDRVMVFWKRDDQELYEHVVSGEVLPNHDGTFQVSVDLDLSSVPAEDWGRYRCVVQLEGIEDIVTRLDPSVILSNQVKPGVADDEGSFNIIGVSVAVLLAAAAAVGGVILYRRSTGGESVLMSDLTTQRNSIRLLRSDH